MLTSGSPGVSHDGDNLQRSFPSLGLQPPRPLEHVPCRHSDALMPQVYKPPLQSKTGCVFVCLSYTVKQRALRNCHATKPSMDRILSNSCFIAQSNECKIQMCSLLSIRPLHTQRWCVPS